MRTCQSCGKENADDQDFCSCGEYLRWEPTGYSMPAITPDQVQPQDPAAAPPPPPSVTPAPAFSPEPGNGHGNGHGHSVPAAPPPPPAASPLPAVAPPGQRPAAKTMVRNLPAVPADPAVPAVPPPPRAGAPRVADRRDELPEEPATIVLRENEQGDYAKSGELEHAVEPGERGRVLALIRNQSGIVDNYDLRVEGIPDDWWSIFPGTVYLVPFGAGGTYEQEVEVHLHPPRTPEAEARLWELKVVADSKASRIVAASAALHLHIGAYEDTATALRPQRRRGRRKATYDVHVVNKANAPVLVALDGEDPDGELQFGFNRPPQEIPPGGSVTTQMQVKPPKQIWIGRGKDRQLSITTITGEEAQARAAAQPLPATVLEAEGPPPKKKWYRRKPKAPRVPGMYPPRVYKPQLYPPDVQFGPGGLNVRMPQMRGPQVTGPQMGGMNARQMMPAGGLKMPKRGGGGPERSAHAVAGRVQAAAVDSVVVAARPGAAARAAVLPVPLAAAERRGARCGRRGVRVRGRGDVDEVRAQAGPVAEDAGRRQGAGRVRDRPDAQGGRRGQEGRDRDRADRGRLGQGRRAGPRGPDRDRSRQGAAREAAHAGFRRRRPTRRPRRRSRPRSRRPRRSSSPVSRSTSSSRTRPRPPTATRTAGGKEDKPGEADGGGAGGGGAGGGAGAEITVPAVGKDDVETYAKKAADLGIVPNPTRRFDDAPVGQLVAVVPEPGTKVEKGAKVQLIVSAGQPQVIFTNEKDILRVNGANGQKLDPIADDDALLETNPTWNAAGTHVAFAADGRIMIKDITKDNADAVPLSPAGSDDSNLAWAPIADTNVIAFTRATAEDADLCFGKVTRDGMDANCIIEPKVTPNRVVHWAPDGKSILAFAGKNDQSAAGIMRWRLKQGKDPFSSNPSDWSKGRFVSDIERPNKIMIDATISPDGKQIAMISNLGSSRFQLFLGDVKNGFDIEKAKKTNVRACKVVWRSDGRELLVIQSDAICNEKVGALVRVGVTDLRVGEQLNASGDDPVYQPLTLEG